MRNTVRRPPLNSVGTITAAVLCSIFLPTCTPTHAQVARVETACDAAMRAEIVDSVSAVLRELYVFSDVAEEMVNQISQRLQNGEYDSTSTVSEFTRTLTDDLRRTSHDRHIRVWYAPPDLVESMSDDTVDAEAEYYRALARDNYYFKKVEILDGNVGFYGSTPSSVQPTRAAPPLRP